MLGSLARWQRLAKTYERGLFDGIFFADTPGVFDRYKERSDEAVRYGVCWPPHDPVVLLSALAAATERLGLAVTLSISANHPYQAVRSLSTLVYLSGGRIGWNIVTGHCVANIARSVSISWITTRYDRARIYGLSAARVGRRSRRALQADKQSGIFADPAKVDIIRHQGSYFRCHGPSALPSRRATRFCFRPARRDAASVSRSRMPTWSSPSSRT